MLVSRLVTISALAALVGCAGSTRPAEFRLAADQIAQAWRSGMQQEEREAEAQGTYPPGLAGPFFSAATCRWVEPGRRALCRYRVSRDVPGRNRERHWVAETAELSLTAAGWSFAR